MVPARTVRARSMSMCLTRATVNSAVPHPTEVVPTVRQANIVTGTAQTNASGVARPQREVVHTAHMANTRNDDNQLGVARLSPAIPTEKAMHVEKFTHNGKAYEIRVICDGETVYAKAFQNNRPANRFRYSATVEVVQDMATVLGTDAVKHLIDIAKQDIIAGLK